MGGVGMRGTLPKDCVVTWSLVGLKVLMGTKHTILPDYTCEKPSGLARQDVGRGNKGI